MEQILNILVIEDDKYISNFISVSLKNSGYHVTTAANAKQGLSLFCCDRPDVLLLDLGLPDRDGLEIIREALDCGADDYITKPFHMGELMARIRVVQRKLTASPAQPSEKEFSCAWLRVDYEKRMVYADGTQIHLTPMEYKLLCLMIENRGKVLTHNYILRQIWGYEQYGDTKSMRVFVASLRRKIEKDPAHPRFILTEIGVGYRFAEE